MDVIAYSAALDKFLVEIERFRDPYSWEIQAVLEDVCEILNIGKIELFAYETLQKEEIEEGDMFTYYLKDTPTVEPAYVGRHVSGRGSVLIFKFYPKVGNVLWREEELNKIKVLDAVLSNLNAKIRLTKFAENAVFYDREMHVPNMSFFQKEASELTALGQIGEYGICFFNLKRFAVINRLLGRELATKAMAQYVVGLQRLLRKGGRVCRVSGDNFIMIFKQSEVDPVVNYLSGTEIVYDNFTNASVVITASAGIYMCPADSNDMIDLTEKAFLALQTARGRLYSSVVFYDDELRHSHEYANQMESVFKESLDREEFIVYYQPKIQLNNYSIAGAEALCRWKHAGDLLMPEDFKPVLELSNSICMLDFYVLDRVCQDIRKWLDQGFDVVRVSVGLSKRHLGDNKLLDKLLEIIDRNNVPHQYIEIVFAETTNDVGFHDLQRIVDGLHSYGIYSSIDDFGVGYSSLNLIRQVPWDAVKIDKSFLPDVSDNSSSQYIMFGHLIAMLRELGLKCIVEGVETIEQVKMLKDNKCYLAQGSFFDNPLTVEEFEGRLA